MMSALVLDLNLPVKSPADVGLSAQVLASRQGNGLECLDASAESLYVALSS